MTRHTHPWKENEVQEIKKLATEYPIIAVADIENFPASLAAQLRKKLKKEGTIIKVTKTRVAQRGLREASLEAKELLNYVKKSIALIFTKTNPFELFAFLKKNKGNMPAKAGMVAEDDILVPAGDTGLPPGPALSDLKAAGLKVRVQGATIAIQEDKIVTREGEEITAAVAGTLSKLDIKPIKVGLNLTVCVENGELFLPSVLNIETEQVFSDFVSARQKAFMLALEIGYLSPETVPVLITKAFRNAKSLALEGNILTPYTIGNVLAKAHAQAVAVSAKVKDVPLENTASLPEQKGGIVASNGTPETEENTPENNTKENGEENAPAVSEKSREASKEKAEKEVK